MLRISVIDLVDGQEAGRTNYPSPIALMVCGPNEVLINYVDGMGCLNTRRINLDKCYIELYEQS